MRPILMITLCGLLGLSATNCNPSPKPIAYGTDTCYFCRMTIVDRQHASEFVTDKGKVYRFDAIECMVNSMKEIGEDNLAIYLCTTFDRPGVLVDATTATFLISKALSSPMGANITAFSNKTEAGKALDEYGGEQYDWPQLLSYLYQ